MKARSVAQIPEEELLKILMADPMCRAWILPLDLRTDFTPLFRVPLDRFKTESRRPEGDIDLLIVQGQAAEHAIAMQFKRVKVGAASFQTGLATKTRQIGKLATQSNILVELGFHRVVAVIVVLVDSRLVSGPNPYLKTTPRDVIREIHSQISEAPFQGLVCVETVEICQPLDKDFRLTGSSGGWQAQQGGSQVQPRELTDAIAKLLKDAA